MRTTKHFTLCLSLAALLFLPESLSLSRLRRLNPPRPIRSSAPCQLRPSAPHSRADGISHRQPNRPFECRRQPLLSLLLGMPRRTRKRRRRKRSLGNSHPAQLRRCRLQVPLYGHWLSPDRRGSLQLHRPRLHHHQHALLGYADFSESRRPCRLHQNFLPALGNGKARRSHQGSAGAGTHHGQHPDTASSFTRSSNAGSVTVRKAAVTVHPPTLSPTATINPSSPTIFTLATVSNAALPTAISIKSSSQVSMARPCLPSPMSSSRKKPGISSTTCALCRSGTRVPNSPCGKPLPKARLSSNPRKSETPILATRFIRNSGKVFYLRRQHLECDMKQVVLAGFTMLAASAVALAGPPSGGTVTRQSYL